MTTSDKAKSLDRIETRLTPQDWAIREADALRKHPTIWGYFDALAQALGKDSIDEAVDALARQAEERYSGGRDANSSAHSELYRRLWTDFFTLIRLLQQVNQTIYETIEKVEVRAALIQSTLLLYAYRNDMKQTDFRSILEKLAQSMMGMLAHVYAHQAAVKIIEDKGFDGHPILARDFEAGLKATIKTIQDGAALFNQCLTASAKLSKRGFQNKPLMIDVDAIKNHSSGEACVFADAWIKQARYRTLIRGAAPEEARRYARQYYRETSQKAGKRNGDQNGDEKSRDLLPRFHEGSNHRKPVAGPP